MKTKHIISSFLALSLLIGSHLLCANTSAKTTKEVWMEFSGTNYCKKSDSLQLAL
jgi:hypothetical protein